MIKLITDNGKVAYIGINSKELKADGSPESDWEEVMELSETLDREDFSDDGKSSRLYACVLQGMSDQAVTPERALELGQEVLDGCWSFYESREAFGREYLCKYTCDLEYYGLDQYFDFDAYACDVLVDTVHCVTDDGLAVRSE